MVITGFISWLNPKNPKVNEFGVEVIQGIDAIFINLFKLIRIVYIDIGTYYLLFLVLFRETNNWNILQQLILLINLVVLVGEVWNKLKKVKYFILPTRGDIKFISDLGEEDAMPYVTLDKYKYESSEEKYRLIKNKNYKKSEVLNYKYYIVRLIKDKEMNAEKSSNSKICWDSIEEINASNELEELKLNFNSIKDKD